MRERIRKPYLRNRIRNAVGRQRRSTLGLPINLSRGDDLSEARRHGAREEDASRCESRTQE